MADQHHREPEPAHHLAQHGLEPMRYPENHVVGIVNTPDAATEVVDILTSGGFFPSEVAVWCGADMADRCVRAAGVYRTIGAFEGKGRFSLRDGKLVTQHQPRPTTLTLYDQDGQRWLKGEGVVGDGLPVSAELRPVP